ncbi:LPS-assembly protein LptD [Helicobacter brantae]|uniref:Uncharacterized protein n=1 Tax=Helicobacter brantae TaxID=375927 RepID=A0A3D8IVR4_9HELI|nr:LPS assembly protein LptD [Helicobacter brantae]RDU69348.1 hypothetical protein CQA58_07185 [Helicobacter brantae]
MPKKILLSLCLALSLHASSVLNPDTNSNLGEVSADELKSEGDKIFGKGNVILVSGEYYVSAQDLVYDKKSKIAEVEGEVRIYYGKDLMLSAKKVKLDFGKDSFSLSSVYFQSVKSGLWITASEARSENNVYYFKESVVSGCNIQSPIWHFDSSSGSLDQENDYLTLWNTRIYLGKMPILYVPYLSVSTAQKRKSGLLYPRLAYLNQDGLYYQQPIYIAPYDSWDMTLSPQIRTSRGIGISGEFRLATPSDNLFTFQTRYFYNTKKYMQTYSALNQHIYGFNLDFETKDGTGIFSSFENIHDGFYSSLNYMNDMEYLKLDDSDVKVSNRLSVSKLNYFLHSQEHFFGIYDKLFLDVTKTNNSNTFQLLPGVQYHKFFDSLFWKELMYSIDVQTNNVTRERGYAYVENTIELPIGVEFPLFNNYLSIGVSTDLKFSNINLYHTEEIQVYNPNDKSTTANFFTANYNASLSTDLARDYGSFMHSIQLMAKASGPYYRYNTPLFNDEVYEWYAKTYADIDTTTNEGKRQVYNLWNPSSIVDFDTNKHRLELQFSQYFYSPDGHTLFYYNASQKLNLQSKKYLFSESMVNEFGSSPIDGLDIKTSLYYSFLYNDIEEVSATIDLEKWHLDTSIGYYYKKLFASENASIDANFLNFSLSNDFGYFAIGGDVNFDFLAMQVKDWSVSISTDVQCFGITLKFAQEYGSILTDNPNRPIETYTNNYIKLEFRLAPLGETGVSYRFRK